MDQMHPFTHDLRGLRSVDVQVENAEVSHHERWKSALNVAIRETKSPVVQAELEGEISNWQVVFDKAPTCLKFRSLRAMLEEKSFLEFLPLGDVTPSILSRFGRNVLRCLLTIVELNWYKKQCLLHDLMDQIYLNDSGGFKVKTQGYNGQDLREYVRQEHSVLRELVVRMCTKKNGRVYDLPVDVVHFFGGLIYLGDPSNPQLKNHASLWSPMRVEGFFCNLRRYLYNGAVKDKQNILLKALNDMPHFTCPMTNGSWYKAFENQLPQRLRTRDVYIRQMKRVNEDENNFKEAIFIFIRDMICHGHLNQGGDKVSLEEIIRVVHFCFPGFICYLAMCLRTADREMLFRELWED